MQRSWQLRAAHLLPIVHRVLRQRFPQALWQGDPDQPVLALTFDDGPHPVDTPALLRVLEQHQVPATFFWLGQQIEQDPTGSAPLVRAAHQAGHQIALHGYRHYPFPLEQPHILHRQLDHTRTLLADACACEPATLSYVRPPFGVFLPDTLTRLTSWHYRPVMWSMVPLHWKQSMQATIDQVLGAACNGALIVLHEGQAHSPPVAELAAAIIPRLLVAGFQFVTIDHMWQMRPPHAAR
jgi:peptidoglycan/xylan/chitin deacetylase (PgdA/CDA1 family)